MSTSIHGLLKATPPELISGAKIFHIMRIAIVLAITIAIATHIALADDLDTVSDARVSEKDRKEAYSRLAAAEFQPIAAKLATLIGNLPVLYLSDTGPLTEKSSAKPKFSEDNPIRDILYRLWRQHTETFEKRGEAIPIMLALLEDPAVGAGRYLAIDELSSRLHFGRAFSDPSLPPIEKVLTRLDRLATDPKQPNDFRRRLVAILFEHGDPNKYLDLAIDLSSREKPTFRESEAFRFCTPTFQASKLTDANRKRYVRHCYKLLEKMDDGRSGSGYFLAMHIGEFLGISPVKSGQGSFAPDQRLPQYHGPHGLLENFFQDTIKNARAWWTKNKDQY